jgi:hypothetical protein
MSGHLKVKPSPRWVGTEVDAVANPGRHQRDDRGRRVWRVRIKKKKS